MNETPPKPTPYILAGLNKLALSSCALTIREIFPRVNKMPTLVQNHWACCIHADDHGPAYYMITAAGLKALRSAQAGPPDLPSSNADQTDV